MCWLPRTEKGALPVLRQLHANWKQLHPQQPTFKEILPQLFSINNILLHVSSSIGGCLHKPKSKPVVGTLFCCCTSFLRINNEVLFYCIVKKSFIPSFALSSWPSLAWHRQRRTSNLCWDRLGNPAARALSMSIKHSCHRKVSLLVTGFKHPTDHTGLLEDDQTLSYANTHFKLFICKLFLKSIC